jgi:hypothetical protein
MMGEVYERASEVVVWLGLEDPHSTFAFTSVQDMGEANIITQEGTTDARRAFEQGTQAESAQKPIARSKAGLDTLLGSFDVRAIADAAIVMLTRPWWHRVWVIQELVLAQRAILRCSPLALPWNSFDYNCESCFSLRIIYSNNQISPTLTFIFTETYLLTEHVPRRSIGFSTTLFRLLRTLMLSVPHKHRTQKIVFMHC